MKAKSYPFYLIENVVNTHSHVRVYNSCSNSPTTHSRTITYISVPKVRNMLFDCNWRWIWFWNKFLCLRQNFNIHLLCLNWGETRGSERKLRTQKKITLRNYGKRKNLNWPKNVFDALRATFQRPRTEAKDYINAGFVYASISIGQRRNPRRQHTHRQKTKKLSI